MAYSAKTIPFIQGGIAGTEPHIDWNCDPAFAGRSVQPIGFVCPGGAEVVGPWTKATLINLSGVIDLLNRLELTVQPSETVLAGTDLLITGLTGLSEPAGSLSTFHSSDGTFTSVEWDGVSQITLTPVIDIPAGHLTTVSFDMFNGSAPQSAITPSLSVTDLATTTFPPMLQLVAPDDVSNLVESGFVITEDDLGNPLTLAALVELTPVLHQLYWVSETSALYMWDGAVWLEFNFNSA